MIAFGADVNQLNDLDMTALDVANFATLLPGKDHRQKTQQIIEKVGGMLGHRLLRSLQTAAIPVVNVDEYSETAMDEPGV